MRAFQMLATCGVALTIATAANAQQIDWKKVDTTLGKTGAVSGEAHRYGFPRSDLQVTVDGVAIKPALALGGWAAFQPMRGEAMVMGDLVLLETEINPVMAKLIEGGIEITAVHNHLLRANPETFYMHIGGHGDPVKWPRSFDRRSRSARLLSIHRRPRQLPRRQSISTRRNSTRSSAPKARSMVASTNSTCRDAIR